MQKMAALLQLSNLSCPADSELPTDLGGKPASRSLATGMFWIFDH